MAGKRKAKVLGVGGAPDGEGEDSAEVLYSKNPEFIGRAFSLYCKGFSLTKLVEALKPNWPGVALRTVQRIARENGWEASRAAFLKLYSDASASAEGLVPEMILQLQKFRVLYEGRSASLSWAEVMQYRALCDDLLWLTGKHPKAKDTAPLAVSGEKEIAALLDAISADEVVGPAWRRRRSHIERAYKEKLRAKGGTRG